jgi:glycosyltransferase involved in cell wall biosynthesis
VAAEFVKFQPKARFFVAGEGPLRPQLEAKARDLGIAQRVNFAGLRKDVPQLLMNVFDVFLFPSLWEGMPLGLVEAAAAGLRTVCSDVITPEATDVMPEAFTRLSLKLPASEWARALHQAANQGRIDQQRAFKVVAESHFSTRQSLRELKGIYASAKA